MRNIARHLQVDFCNFDSIFLIEFYFLREEALVFPQFQLKQPDTARVQLGGNRQKWEKTSNPVSFVSCKVQNYLRVQAQIW